MMEFTVYTGKLKGKIQRPSHIQEIKWIDSQFTHNGLKVGNITFMKLFPKLKEEGLIN